MYVLNVCSLHHFFFQLQAVSAAAPPVTQPLISVMGTVVPQPPPLTGNVDPTKIEEIRRTVYVGNLSTKVHALYSSREF